MALKDSFVQGLMQAFDTPWPGPRGQRFVICSQENNLEQAVAAKTTAASCSGNNTGNTPELELTVLKDDAARIQSLKFHGVELLRQHNPQSKAFQYGCFPMIPWVGRMKGGDITFKGQTHHLYQNKGQNAMHGMAHFEDWELISYQPNAIKLAYNVGEPWPWPCKVEQRLELRDHKLFMELKISTTQGEFPVDAGWHPWFLKDPDHTGSEQLQVQFKADDMEEIGPDEIPTGKKLPVNNGPWDDCFNFYNSQAQAKLIYPGKREITITSNCPALIVFNKLADATCVNTMSGVPNGVNTNPHVISPIQPLEVKAVWSFTQLS